MGDIAELIVNGDMCACGCALETPGEGYQRACSQECAKDFNCPIGK